MIFSICNFSNAGINAKSSGSPDTYYLTLYGFCTDGVVPLDASWTSSNPAIATISGNILTASQNGRVEVNANYEGQTYTKDLSVYNTFETLEVESNNTFGKRKTVIIPKI